MRSLAFKETALGLGCGRLASSGETSTRACSLRMWMSKRIEKFSCAKRAAAVRKSARSKTKTPRGAAEGRIRGLGPELRGGKGLHDSEEDVKHEKKSRRVPMKEISS